MSSYSTPDLDAATELFPLNQEQMEMIVGPSEGELQSAVQIGDGQIGADQ